VLVHEAHDFMGVPTSTLTQSVCLWRRALRSDFDGGVDDVCNVAWLSTFATACEDMVEAR